MAKTFNLAEHLAAVAPVSNSDTNPVIKMLPVRKIFPNENNFYDTSNIDELVNSILMYGVLDPITVRPSGDGEGYIIISGHRRHRAVTKILDESLAEDTTKYQVMPCIIRDPKDELLEELMLIQANSATRVLTSAEVSKQVERVERLLYELKEQGYEFPGRMRDNVAQACNVSASKIARLKVIREKLIPAYAAYYEKGDLTESVAYTLAQQPPELQNRIFDLRKEAFKGDENKAVKYLAEWKVKDIVRSVNEINGLTCTRGKNGSCSNCENKLHHVFSKEYSYNSCSNKCCLGCDSLSSCKDACPLLSNEAKELKEKKKQERQAEKAASAEESRAEIEMRRNIWQRYGTARRRAGQSVEASLKAQGKWYNSFSDKEYEEKESGQSDYKSLQLPLPIFAVDIRNIVALADLFDCSIDYLLCRTDEPTISTAEAVPTWRTGVPETSGLYAAKFDCSGHVMKKLVYYDNCLKKFYFDESHGRSIEAACVGWYPVPQDKEDE